ncbi:MAG TPA: hypothetical protein PKD09_24235 [Aggregatilinea sp.]|uniref:hypothetical protein n=1 Tax=Aggregatilinea sp. TaxID=2806333 RepID=UPI002CEBDB8C|nr:hypothetical protein [Aggregatilinea sp.]HML24785.1 hypothetical protein [Aggregatilinea sp.]
MRLEIPDRIWLFVVAIGTIVLSVFACVSDAVRMNAIAGILVAAGTLVLALITHRSIEETKKANDAQIKRAQRPLLVPKRDLPVQFLDNITSGIPLDIQNVGTGVATNIWGVLAPHSTQNLQNPPYLLSVRYPLPLPHSETTTMNFEQGGITHFDQDQICDKPLFLPANPSSKHPYAQRFVARLTLTYRDIFGDKHSSTFDLTQNHVWVQLAICNEISKDLEEVDAGNLGIVTGGASPAPTDNSVTRGSFL